MEQYIYYKVGDKTAKVKAGSQSAFEEKYPDAKVYFTYEGRNAAVPLSQRDAFVSKYGAENITYSAHDDNNEYSADLSVTKYQPTLTQEEPAEKPEKKSWLAEAAISANDSLMRAQHGMNKQFAEQSMETESKREGPSWLESGLKGAGAGFTRFGKGLYDTLIQLSSNYTYIDPLTGELVTTPDYDTLMKNKDEIMVQEALKAGEVADRLSKEADPTGGEAGFVDLIKDGKIGVALQKGLATGAESLPMTLSAANPYTMALNMVSMAGSNYAEQTLDNPEVDKWKRATMAIGSAALEQAVEKFADPVFKYIGGGNVTSEITEEIAKEILQNGAEEAVETIAKRIINGLKPAGRIVKNTLKDAGGEGVEEVVTSFGNDLLGEALDLISGDKDFGIRAQWEKMKEENPDASLVDFAKSKAKEYMDSFIGGALSGTYMSGTTQTINEVGLNVSEKASRKAVDDSYKIGAGLDYQDMYDSDDIVKEAKGYLTESLIDESGNAMLSEEFIDGLTAENAYLLSRSENITPQQKKAFEDLARAKAVQEGLTKKLDDRFNEYLNTQRAIIEGAVENGAVVTAMHNGRAVYVIGGDVQNDGTVKINGTDGPVIVRDAVTGVNSSANTNEITDASAVNAEQFISETEASLRATENEHRETARNTMSPRAKMNSIQPLVGRKILVDSGNGLIEVEVQRVLAKSGEIQIKGKKGDLGGQSIIRVPVASFYDSISRDEDGNPIFAEGQTAETPVSEETPEAPVAETPVEEVDYRGEEVTILINGVPTKVDVTAQDNTAGTITYEYTDENGKVRTGGMSIGDFVGSIYNEPAVPETPVVPEAPEAPTDELPPIPEGGVPVVPDVSSTPEPAPVEVPVTPETVNWDELFEQDKETFFTELQKQFGDSTIDILNDFISSAQQELDAINKSKAKGMNEIVANREKKIQLQNRIDALNEMVERLTPAPEAPVAPTAETPETPTPEVPETPAEPAGEQPTAPETPAEPAPAEPTEPEEPTEPAPTTPTQPTTPTEPAPTTPTEPIPAPTPAPAPKTGGAFGRMVQSFKSQIDKLIKKTEVKDFVGTDNTRPVMTGVYRANGYEYASDSMILVKVKAEYPAEQEGKIISVKTSKEIQGRYPDADGVIASSINNTSPLSENIDDIIAYAQTLEEIKKGMDKDAKLYVKVGNSLFESTRLLNAAKIAKKHGLTNILQRSEAGRAMVFEGSNGAVLVMPTNASMVSENIFNISTGFGEFGFNALHYLKTPATLKGIEAAKTTLEAVLPKLSLFIKDQVKTSGELQYIDGKVVWRFNKADIAKAKAKAKDANTYAALEEIENNGLVVPMSQSDAERIFPELFVSDTGVPTGEDAPTVPVAPNPVANPISEAKKKERQLALNLAKIGLSPEQKQDLAFNAGKSVADMFATREEYDAYAENAEDFGQYNADFDRGVEESFANRKSPVNSVPLSPEPKGDSNGENKPASTPPANTGRGSDTTGGRTNNGGSKGKSQGSQTTKSPRNSKSQTKVEDKYPARNGNATGKLLVDTFGFASVAIPDTQKKILNTIYDFMMEMSKTLGISPKTLGQGGWLNIRNKPTGKSNIASHEIISNTLTKDISDVSLRFKYSRLSSIAHEWWHSLDRALSYFETGKIAPTATEISESAFTGRKEAWEAVQAVMKALNDSGYTDRIRGLVKNQPRKVQVYYMTPTEQAASAFDQYISDRFAEAGIVIQNYDNYSDVTQPTAEEMKVVAPAIDNLFKVLKEKEGKKAGTSVLYQIGEALDNDSPAKQLATDAVLTALDDSGVPVKVVSDEEVAEMLRIRDEVSNPSLELMTVYHGSKSLFDEFDNAHMGEGEGAQAHGWGAYVAVDKKVGIAYANMYGVRYVGPKVEKGSVEESAVEAIAGFMNSELSFDEAVDKYIAICEKVGNDNAMAAMTFAMALNERDFASRNLYTVEIPDNNGSNYFDEGVMSKEQTERFVEACEKEGVDWIEVVSDAGSTTNIMNNPNQGSRIYRSLAKALGSKQKASELLAKAGFVGIKYNGRRDGECYVIFDEKNLKITDRTEFYQTPNGTVYGWADGKGIYLTKAGINPNTPIHEYTHLWAKAMMQKNPKGWQRIKDLLRNTPAWNDVLNDANYSNIHNDEDAVASEALSRISGTENAAKMEKMAQKMLDDAKGTMRKAEARGLIQNMKDALNLFWEFVWNDLFKMTYFRNVEHITDRVLWDMLNGTDLGTISEGQIEAQIVTDPKVIAELEASPKQTGYRNVVKNEDGTFSSPMAYWLQGTKSKGGAKSRVETAKFEMGKWEEAEEHPELVDDNGHVVLVKPNKDTVEVAYDPYIHNRLDPVNLQFKQAWERPDLVYVKTEVADTDLQSEYHADGALLPVGVHPWSNGYVMLSRYDKPVAEMDWSDVADAWAKRLNGEGVHFDVVPPALRQPLVERGVEILPPHKGMGKDCNDAYAEWKKENPQSDPRDKSTSPSPKVESNQTTAHAQTKDAAKIAKSIETLKELSQRSKNERVTSPDKIVNYLADALNITIKKGETNNTSKRNKYVLPSGETLSVRVSKHNVSARTYIEFNFNQKYNLAITFKSVRDSNNFKADDNVRLDEFVYFTERVRQYNGSVLSEVALSLANFLETGIYEDTTRLAIVNTSPTGAQPRTKENYSSEILSRRDDIQNAAIDNLVGKPRLRAIENAVSEEAQKLGVNVTYKTREEMPKGHKNDKGYFNTKTGEIVICTENATSVADAIQTILHEAVAHKGLRQLMGDKFNEFINRVYDSLDAETKAKVDALAEASYNGNKAVAMEEYLASLAETMNFEDRSVWDKVKSIFEDIINAILGRNDIKIGDNELRYILRASYNNMVNPRNMETIQGWAKDQMMREEYNVNQATPELLSRTGVTPDDVASSSARAVYDRVVNSTWNEFQRQFQDAFQPVRVAIEAIQAETGNIPIEDYENYLLVQNQSSSRSRVEIDDFARRYYSPIIEQVNATINKIMELRGLDTNDKAKRAEVYQELKQYLIAKHGLERNEYYQTHKTRKLYEYEQKKERDKAKKDYDDKVDAINNDTTITDAERQLQLRDALDEYNAALIEIKTREVPYMRDYSGLTSLFGMKPRAYKKAEAEAQKLVDDFEKELGRVDDPVTHDVISQSAEIEKLWKSINSATDKTLRHSYESGLLSRQQYEDIKAMFNFYIPLRGFDETTAEDVYSYARFEGNRFNPAVETAKGRTSVANDPIAIIMNMAESEIAQGNKNRAKQALYNYLLNRMGENNSQNSLMQIEEVWYEKITDATGNETFVIAYPDRSAGETYEEFEDRMKALEATDDAYRSKKGNKVDVGKRFQKTMDRSQHYIYLKMNGVEKAIYVNGDPKAADAVNGRLAQKQTWVTEKMKMANRLLSSTFTNYSLGFTARNYFRDMMYAHINIDVKESDPAYRKKFRQNWRHNNMKNVWKLLSAYRSGELDGRALTEDEAAFVEFMNNGGQTGYTVINSVENHKAELDRAIKRMQKGIEKGGVKDTAIFKYTLGMIEYMNEVSELVTRFAAFKTSRDMGRGINRAINDAKEITVNFNTRGAQDGKGFWGGVAQYFGWSKFFFNASVQGVQNIVAMAKANKLKFCTTVGGVAFAGFLVPVITKVLCELFGDDDDEYWNIPEYDRQNNLCIIIPFTKGKYAKIPLPIGFREVYAIGDMVAGAVMDKKFTRDVSQIGMDVANKISSVLLPINPLESSVNGLNFWHTFLYTSMPSSLQFAIQNATNIDWKGAPLQKEYTYNENDPQWMKAYESNPDWIKGLSKWCNEHINLDGDYEGLDWSPEKLDNTLSNLFGGVYSLINQGGRMVSMVWNSIEEADSFLGALKNIAVNTYENPNNVPLASVVIGSGIDSDERFVTDAYYDMKEYYDSNIGAIKRRAKKFGYSLDDIFVEEKGGHQPKVNEIYQNKNFDFMQEWYKGNKELESLKDKIDRREKKINATENPTEEQLAELLDLQNQFETFRREFVDDMLELD